MLVPLFRSTARSPRPCRLGLGTLLVAGLTAAPLSALAAPAAPAEAAAAGTSTSHVVGAVPVLLAQATDPGAGVLKPTAAAATTGMFGPQVQWPLVAIHAALDRAGDLITFGTPLHSSDQGGVVFDRWTPADGFGTGSHADTASMTDDDTLCDALVRLQDGRILMVGGVSAMKSMIYDPATGTVAAAPDLVEQRWYATSIPLEDGRVLVLGGSDPYATNGLYATTPEIGDGVHPWQQLAGATSADVFGTASGFDDWYYPRAFNAAGDTVVGSSGDEIWSLDPSGAASVQRTGTLPFNPQSSGSQVMFAPGQVLVAGGGSAASADDVPGTDAAAVWSTAEGTATSTSPMHFARNWLNLTVLPTGTVWANGGTTVGMGMDAPSQSVKQSELWNPATGQWTLAATAQRTRTYHSTSLLLPSGAVFTGGSGSPGPENNLNAELYYPSYLFTRAANGSVQWASRPSITAIAGSAAAGGTVDLTVGSGQRITSASLITLGSVTHSQNTDQRRIPLATAQSGDQVRVVLPSDAGTMPAGDYELTVTNSAGVPSPAQVVTIRTGQPGLVTTGAAQPASSGSGSASVSTSAPLALDRSVGLRPVDEAGDAVSSSGSAVQLQPVSAASTVARRAAASWSVRTGLGAADGYSFESVAKPGWYLAAASTGGGRLGLQRYSASASFAQRATFAAGSGVAGRGTTLRLWRDRALVVQHAGATLVAQRPAGSAAARDRSSFAVQTGAVAATPVRLTSGASIGLEPAGRPGSLLRERGTAVSLQRIGRSSTWTLKDDASWIVHTSRRGVSFESRARPGWFLAAASTGSSRTVLARRSGAASFAARSTFTIERGGRSLRIAAWPSAWLTQTGAALELRPLGATAAARTAATFTVRSGLAPRPVG